jgi:DNA invertase Pin-like site-specific DNA recombinase
MNSQIMELMTFWNKLKGKSIVVFEDMNELEKIFGKALQKMDELQKRGDHFKALYEAEKNKKK